MGQIVVGAVGAAVGFAVGGPTGAQWGWGIGQVLYGAFQKPDTQRVSQPLIDLKVVGTEYGQPIPWIRGRLRSAGQLWWNTDRRPIRSVTRSGGSKGGPSAPEQETESITYEIDALYGLTTDNGKPLAGDKIVGVAGVYDNGKLIWSQSAALDGAALTASDNTKRWRRMTVYKGAADQMPDPTYEAAILAQGKRPLAYRHRSTVFIEGLQLGQGGQLPNLTFDVIVDGEEQPVVTYTFGASNAVGAADEEAFFDGNRYIWLEDATTDIIAIHDPIARTWLDPISPTNIPAPDDSGGENFSNYTGLTNNGNNIVMIPVPEWNRVYITATFETALGAGAAGTLAYKIDSREFQSDINRTIGVVFLQQWVIAADPTNQRILVHVGGPLNRAWRLYGADRDIAIYPGILAEGAQPNWSDFDATSGIRGRGIVDSAGNFWFKSGDAGTGLGFRRIYDTGGILQTQLHSAGADGYDSSVLNWAYDASRNCIYYFSQDRLWLKRFNCSDQSTERVNAVAFSNSPADDNYFGAGDTIEPACHYSAEEDAIILLHGGQGALHWGRLNASSGALEAVVNHMIGAAAGVAFSGEIVYSPGVTWSASHRGSGSDAFGIGELRNGIAGTCPPVSVVQAAICERCGLTPNQYDVTDLSTITRGVCAFPWSQPSGGREPTERLMSSYYYELTVSDKIYFRARGGAPVATIEYEELGAHDGGGNPPEPLPLRQGNDIELSAQIALTYANLLNDYQTDTQTSDRLISAVAGSVATVSMSMGFEPDEAKAIANTMLLDQVLALVSGEITVLGHYASIEPTDVIVVRGRNGESFRTRVVKKRDAFPVIGLTLVLDEASILQGLGITDLDYTSSTSVNGPVDTLMELLDIPILRDADNDGGFYVATKGTGVPYAGSAVYKSTNDIDFDDRVATVQESAVFGRCTTILGDWTGPRIFDEVNSVTVNLGRGEASSTTRDLILNSSANAFLIGNEIVQARDAEYLGQAADGGNLYELRYLLRGCRGTEWAMTDHVANERCVLLRMTGLRRVSLDNSEIGVDRYYKGVTLGRPESSAPSQSFASGAVGLKPFAPVDLRASRDDSGNVTFTAQRRSRLSVRMIGEGGINVPLGEESEAYEWDIYDPSPSNAGYPNAVIRTLTSSTPEVTYSTTQQAEDGYSPFDPVDVGVYQISAAVGRGYELRGTV